MEQAASTKFVTIGNGLTASRLVLLPVIVGGIATHHGWLAVGGMVAAVVTDLLDGRVSRRLRQASAFGATLDSTIDFVLIYSLFMAFYASGRLATYQFIILYVSMLSNLLLQLGSMGNGNADGVVRTVTGKITGALQYTYLLFLVVCEVLDKSKMLEMVNLAMFSLVAVTIALSTVRFVIRLKDMVKPRASDS
ncbi:MAG: CDP-alcohol phosphatidyltransferase family protein [Armatimonadota bacterium]